MGDGYALAYRAGAELNNLEFIQFMLGLKMDGLRQFLSLTNLWKPGTFCDSKGGDLLETCIPNPRARAKAIHDRQSHFPFSCRDASHHIDIAVAKEHQQGRKVARGGGDSMQDRGEVVHFAHAFNGGVKINERAESTIPGLFAIGEVAAGPHGADRIGGCMMTATQVYGERAGRFAAKRALETTSIPEIEKTPTTVFNDRKESECDEAILGRLKASAKDIIGSSLAVLRDEKGLLRCLNTIRGLKWELVELGWYDAQVLIPYSSVKTMLIVGELIAESGLRRKASLGSHFRTDTSNHPQKTKDILDSLCENPAESTCL
jgi:L-aspartate oxidase